MSETENAQEVAAPVEPMVTCFFAVFTDHNRYGDELRGVFRTTEEAEILKAYFDKTKDGWKNHTGGYVRKVVIADSCEQWLGDRCRFDCDDR